MAEFVTESLFCESGFSASVQGNNSFPDMKSLSPFLRVLLTLDGTVTKALESYYWEPVRIDVVFQEVLPSQADLAVLDCGKNDEVLVRQVNLVGAKTGRTYSSAESLIFLQRLPEHLKRQLLDGDIGIGQLLRRHVLETYREILLLGTGRPKQRSHRELYDVFSTLSPTLSSADHPKTAVWRIYRVLMNGDPAVLIRENFFIDA